MADSEYRQTMPEPQLAHELWSREICDRLDKMVKLLEGQNKILSGTQTVTVSGPVELAEPKPAKPAQGPVKASTSAPAARTGSTTSSTAKK